jgi:hypothetical protein
MATKKNNEIVVELELEKTTKNWYRFKGDDDAVINSLYVRQDAFSGQPKKIKCVVTEIE